MYGAMGTWPTRPSDGQMLDLALPKSWGNGRAYRVDGTALTGDAPLMVSYTRGDQMLVVVRGTVYSREWCVRWAPGRAGGRSSGWVGRGSVFSLADSH